MKLLLSIGTSLSVLSAAFCCSQLEVVDRLNHKLPRIYEYDDFDTCRRKYTEFVYCITTTELLADVTNELWNNISLLTLNRKNFAHDHLERGLCVNDYQYTGGHDDRQPIDVIEDHLARKLYKRYGLHSRSKVESCWTTESFRQATTNGEWFFISVSFGLCIVTITATWKSHGRGSRTVLMDAFSIQQTMRRLVSPARSKSLPLLEGLRALGMLTILIVHSQLPMIRMPVKNTEDLEAQANHFLFPLINSGNTHMIQFFFTLGGMVFAVGCLTHFERYRTFNGWYFLEKLLRRLVRILPAYAFIIFYQATVYKRVKQGPLEHKFSDHCSDHWWTNVLFVNNYVHPTKPCLQYGWYLGADLHLFLIGSLLFMFIWRFPQTKPAVAFVMLLSTFLIPAYVIYTRSIAATMAFDMRHALAELRTYDHFLEYYLPSHTNMGGYFLGMISAMLYKRITTGSCPQDRIRSNINTLFGWCVVALVALNAFTMVLPLLVIEPRFSIFHATYGSLLKASWGCSYGVLFLFLALKSKSILVDLLSHPLMHCLAKLSYCIYLVQYSVIYGIYTNFPVPLVYGAFNLIMLTSASLTLSLISAVLLHIAVEAPIGVLGNKLISSLVGTGVVSNEKAVKRFKDL